jgi:hypothetical protein
VPARVGEYPVLPGDTSLSTAFGKKPQPAASAARGLGDASAQRHNGRDLEQWEYEVTSGGRVRYVIDDQDHTVWLLHASPRHPKDTDR